MTDDDRSLGRMDAGSAVILLADLSMTGLLPSPSSSKSTQPAVTGAFKLRARRRPEHGGGPFGLTAVAAAVLQPSNLETHTIRALKGIIVVRALAKGRGVRHISPPNCIIYVSTSLYVINDRR